MSDLSLGSRRASQSVRGSPISYDKAVVPSKFRLAVQCSVASFNLMAFRYNDIRFVYSLQQTEKVQAYIDISVLL